jgi:hypothetical protein
MYWFKKSANQECDQAQYNLGKMYLNGHGVKQDHKKALYWFEQSANQRFTLAQQALEELKLMQKK